MVTAAEGIVTHSAVFSASNPMRRAVVLLCLLQLGTLQQALSQSLLTGPPTTTITAPATGSITPTPSTTTTNTTVDPCGVDLTFFPLNYENTNNPTAWTSDVQQSVGNNAADQLVEILLSGYPIPALNVMPVSPYTDIGGSVPQSCLSGAAPASTGRRMHQTGSAILTTPATFYVTWALYNSSDVLGPYTKGSKTDPPPNATLSVVPYLPDGEYCANITVTVQPKTGVAQFNGKNYKVPTTQKIVSRQACFIKMGRRPTANFTYHSCNTSLIVDLTRITPPPQFATHNNDLQMSSTKFHVWGKLNSTFDTAPQDITLVNYYDQYVEWSDPTQPNILVVDVDATQLMQGYYNSWVEGSIATDVAALVNLFGADVYPDGTSKFMGITLRNTSAGPIPIQSSKTTITNLAGPDTTLSINDTAAFSWDVNGYGEQFCYVDGVKISNTQDKVHCVSPLELVISDKKNHTLQVVMNDVCHNVVVNGIDFGLWGWQWDAKYVPPAPPSEPLASPAAPVTAVSMPTVNSSSPGTVAGLSTPTPAASSSAPRAFSQQGLLSVMVAMVSSLALLAAWGPWGSIL